MWWERCQNWGLSGGAEPTVSLREWGQLWNTQGFGILRKGGKPGQEAKISSVLQEAWGKEDRSPFSDLIRGLF